jgi:quinoprotein glucose dehydrogenase
MMGDRRVSLRPYAAAALAVALAMAAVAVTRAPGLHLERRGGIVAGWAHYGADAGGTRYSPSDQISRENVDRLEVAWTYRTGDVSDGSRYPRRSSFETTPILFEGALYLSTPFSRVIALDPETGRELWAHDPGLDLNLRYSESLVSRGVAAWRDPEAEPDALCASVIFFGVLDARLIALDAKSGGPCPGFGDSGQVDLKVGVGEVELGEYEITSPPVVVGDVVVLGSAVGDNRRVEVERGTIRGYDARSGELRWAFDPVPRAPDHPAWDAWQPEHATKTGAANAWAPLSADPERGLVFAPTGSAAPDFYGGERLGDDPFANSVLALNAATGELVWSFQVVHHDLWDYDVASQPTLATLTRDGAHVPAVIQATKMGHIFVLHRETGEPLFPVEERAVPQTDVPGERTSPTQPFPTLPPPLHPEVLTGENAFGLTPIGRGKCRKRMEALRYEGIFTPPSLGGSLEYPSMIGGANWGGVALQPERQLMVVNLNRFASWVRRSSTRRAARPTAGVISPRRRARRTA